jgi:hypothetical protein
MACAGIIILKPAIQKRFHSPTSAADNCPTVNIDKEIFAITMMILTPASEDCLPRLRHSVYPRPKRGRGSRRAKLLALHKKNTNTAGVYRSKLRELELKSLSRGITMLT